MLTTDAARFERIVCASLARLASPPLPFVTLFRAAAEAKGDKRKLLICPADEGMCFTPDDLDARLRAGL
jgi:hypothetical protein